MKRKLLLLLGLIVIVGSVYLEARQWRRFDWANFREGLEGINWWMVLVGVVLVYVADALRAIRWKIFLRPSRPKASWRSLVAPQYVGFTGLAVLGRPGEFIRPFLIARREDVTVASQVAIWLVERVFDVGAVVLIFAIDVFSAESVKELEAYASWQRAGYIFAALFLALVVAVLALWARGPDIARWICGRVSSISPRLGTDLEAKVLALSAGLHTIHSWIDAALVAITSFVIWGLVAMAFWVVVHAYPIESGAKDLHMPEVILVMFASVAGGVVQLPVIGGGSQVAAIGVLNSLDLSPEASVSCGILLYLVAFMSIIPLGLILAHREHLSLRGVTRESKAEADLHAASDVGA